MNCILYKKNTDRILHFIENCIQEGTTFTGSNEKLSGVKIDKFDILWTEEEIIIEEKKEKNNEYTIKTYNKKPSEITVSNQKIERHKTTHSGKISALKMRQNLDLDNINNIINNLQDIEQIKDFLKDLAVVISGIIKFQDR